MLLLLYVLQFLLHTCLCVDLTYYVEEEKRPGTLVGDIAIDSRLLDSIPKKDHNLITFSLLQQGVAANSQLFRISKNSGKLYTAQTLDAELLCSRNVECFSMVDVAVKKANFFFRILEIKVVIKDINEHQPKFLEKEISIRFSENDAVGTKISIPNAIDNDVGVENSKITYFQKVSGNEPFMLSVSKNADGTSKLSIKLEKRLDREMKDSYLIQIIAKDGGSPPKQNVLTVKITVSDINDNTPEFSQKVYNVFVKNEPNENSPIAVLSAKDKDSKENSKISYHFSSQTSNLVKEHFSLNKDSGEIFLHKKFMLGEKLMHKLYVAATDKGDPPLSSFAEVVVNLINKRNNAPTIDVNFVSDSAENTLTISENIEVGRFIAYVKVTDHDVGQNGEVTCALHHDKFQLQSLGVKKYKITIKNPVDRETEDHHDITINCQDKGSPPLHAESKFSVKVIDYNDVQPQFSKDTYKFWIYENQEPKIPVGYINATDPDLGPGGKLTYSLLTNNKQFLPFKITDNGLISTIVSLDHEFQDVYKFQILVKDRGTPSLNNTVNIVVEVKDKNDNAPYFTFPSVNPFTLDVVYYPQHTNNITVLKASDSDSRENAFLKYEITTGNDKQLFTINHYTGLLSFTRALTQQDSGSYELEFLVKDSGNPVLSATTSLLLAVTISNKTTEMLNAIYIQSDDKIHLNSAIVIVLVAVTVSVVITASLLICILRCHDWTNTSRKQGESGASSRCVHERGHSMCSSYQGTLWSDGSNTAATDPSKIRITQLKASGKDSQLSDKQGSGQKDLVLPLEPQISTDFSDEVSGGKI